MDGFLISNARYKTRSISIIYDILMKFFIFQKFNKHPDNGLHAKNRHLATTERFVKKVFLKSKKHLKLPEMQFSF